MTKDLMSALLAHFKGEWASRTPLLFSGATEGTPATGNWIRYTIRPAQPFVREIVGERSKKYTPGRIYIQAFCPLSKGDGPAIGLADQAASIYQLLTLPDFEFELPLVENIGESQDGKWYQVNCEVNFRAVETIVRQA